MVAAWAVRRSGGASTRQPRRRCRGRGPGGGSPLRIFHRPCLLLPRMGRARGILPLLLLVELLRLL